MTVEYKVVSRHSKEVLEDFIKFDNQVRHPMSKYHLVLLSVGFVGLGVLSWETSVAVGIMGLIVALLLILTLIFRRKIAFYRLSEQDDDYKKESDFEYLFGQTKVVIKNLNWNDDVRMEYNEINALYRDEKNYYICRNNMELYLLPIRDFLEGDATEFPEFIERKSGRKWLPTKMSFKERLHVINERRKEANRLHDELIAKSKEEKRKSKR